MLGNSSILFSVYLPNMRHLRNTDYRRSIMDYDLDTLLLKEVSPESVLFDAELRSQEQISLFLRKRYDLADLFRVFSDYVSGYTYSSGDTVWYSASGDSYLYSPKSTTTTAPASPDWILVEPRQPLVVDWMISLTLYKLHERVSPQNIPVHRKNSYDETMKILKMIQEERLSPDFQEVQDRSYAIYITGKKDAGISTLW